MRHFLKAAALCTALGVFLSSASMHHAHAQTPLSAGCLQQIYTQLSHKQEEYRTTIFGQQKAEDAAIGTVRKDKEGVQWIKTDTDEWKAASGGNAKTDSTMDTDSMFKNVRGILDIRRSATSELIPMLLQSTRALGCAAEAVCNASEITMGMDNGTAPTEEVKSQPKGCIEYTFTFEDFSECKPPTIANVEPGSCQEIAEGVVAREMQMLELIVSYDAAYRSMVQFAGIFEGFMNTFQEPLLKPIWEMVRALGTLDGLPCFLSQCNE